MKKVILTEILFLRKKTKSSKKKKNVVVHLLKLIQAKKAMMQTMKLVEYKHLAVYLKTEN